MIINKGNVDINESKIIRLTYSDLVENNECYMNIFNLVFSEAIKDYLVAFGYCGYPSCCMIRHCYFISNDKSVIIDPTLTNNIVNKWYYHTIKTYTIEEYKKIVKDGVFNNKHILFNSSFKPLLKKEDRSYCKFAINNKIFIEKSSYLDFLSEYDTKHIIKTFPS